MSKENPRIKSVLKSLFQGSIDKLIREDPSASIAAIYIQFDSESGEVQVYDERERLLQKKVIFDWVGADAKDSAFISKMVSVMCHAIEMLATDGVFKHALFTTRPFSICLTDEVFRTMAIIYALPDDDEDVYGEGPLMKDIDKELDVFLKKLLSDVE